jgi:aspartate racemase
LGLIGGLGVGAAVHYYQQLAKLHEQRGISMDLVMAHAEVPRVMTYVQGGDRAGLTAYLMGFVRRLQAAGAEFVIVPAVTPHFCIRELAAASPLPVFNIFEPLREELTARAIDRVALFGTRFVMESRLYGMVHGVEIVAPRAEEVDYIHNVYVELALRGEGSEPQYRGLTELAQRLCERDGVQAIVLAGTDLTLLFNEENTRFPHVDCAALHLRAIAKAAID